MMVTVTAAPHATTPLLQGLTTPLPGHTDSVVIGVVVFLVLLTLACLSFLLCRYMYANRGDYRTTGEPAPGEDLEQADYDKEPDDKKEYFI